MSGEKQPMDAVLFATWGVQVGLGAHRPLNHP